MIELNLCTHATLQYPDVGRFSFFLIHFIYILFIYTLYKVDVSFIKCVDLNSDFLDPEIPWNAANRMSRNTI